MEFDAGRILGALHIPARAKQPAKSLAFVWQGPNVLLVASQETGAALLAQVLAMRPHEQGGAGDFLVDLLTALIQDGLPYESTARNGPPSWSRRFWPAAPTGSSTG